MNKITWQTYYIAILCIITTIPMLGMDQESSHDSTESSTESDYHLASAPAPAASLAKPSELVNTLKECHTLLAIAHAYNQERKKCDHYAALFKDTLGGQDCVLYAAGHTPTSAAAKTAFLRHAKILNKTYVGFCKELSTPAEITVLAESHDREIQTLARQVVLQTIAISHSNNSLTILQLLQEHLPDKECLKQLLTHPKMTPELSTTLKQTLESWQELESYYRLEKALKEGKAPPKLTLLYKQSKSIVAKADAVLAPLFKGEIALQSTASVDLIMQARAASVKQIEQDPRLYLGAKTEIFNLERAKRENNDLTDKQVKAKAARLLLQFCESFVYASHIPSQPLQTFLKQLARPAESYITKKALARTAYACCQTLAPKTTTAADFSAIPFFSYPETTPLLMAILEKSASRYEEELCGPLSPRKTKKRYIKSQKKEYPKQEQPSTTPLAAAADDAPIDCREDVGIKELLCYLGKKHTTSTEPIDEINLPTNPYQPHIDGSYLQSIDPYAITVYDPKGFIIRLYRTDEHAAQPIHTSYHPRIYRWFTNPSEVLAEYIKKQKIPKGVSAKDAIFYHAFARRVDSFAPILGIETSWPGQTKDTKIICVLSEIEDEKNNVTTGACTWCYNVNTGTCYHRGITKHPWNSLVKSKLEKGFQLLHPEEIAAINEDCQTCL